VIALVAMIESIERRSFRLVGTTSESALWTLSRTDALRTYRRDGRH
jgi:hypothetical protein